MYESCRKHNFSYIVFYIYIYIQVFSNYFLQNQQNIQRNALFQVKTAEIIVYFGENEWKQIVPLCSRRNFVRFALYLRRLACAATITENLYMISWRNRPRIPATDAKISPPPEIYPPPPGYASWLAAWRSFLIFWKIFGIIIIQSKGKTNNSRTFTT